MFLSLTRSRSRLLLRGLLYATFFLTGVSIASFGAMLSLLMPLWHLSDAGAGVLLFAFFVGGSAGSLAARGRLRRTMSLGGLLAGMATTMLAVSSVPPLVSAFLFGFALGLCMTSISLQQSRAYSEVRVAELARLNVVWAAGALAGPAMCLRTASASGPRWVFLPMAALFLMMAIANLLLPEKLWQQAQAAPVRTKSFSLRHVLPLLCVIPLATGLESAAGGWLTTYASRNGMHLLGDIGLPSIFWAGLLLCRITYSSQRIAAHAKTALRLHPWIVVAGTLLLCVGHTSLLLFPGAFLMGWGIGSLYPIALAFLLEQTELGNFGFLIAGIGGSCLPLFTGFISQATQSIRAGMAFLVVPALCLAIAARSSSLSIAQTTKGNSG